MLSGARTSKERARKTPDARQNRAAFVLIRRQCGANSYRETRTRERVVINYSLAFDWLS